jgi:hypothetical protein
LAGIEKKYPVVSEFVNAFMPTPPARATMSSNSFGWTYSPAFSWAFANASSSSAILAGSPPPNLRRSAASAAYAASTASSAFC